MIGKVCPRCNEYMFEAFGPHKCKPAYFVRPDFYDPGDETEAFGDSPADAAEKWYERRFADFDYITNITLIVIDPRKNIRYTVEVEVESVPSFSASVEHEEPITENEERDE